MRNVGVIPGNEFFQDKSLEKPSGVGNVPFRRADIGHRLHDKIFGLKICA